MVCAVSGLPDPNTLKEYYSSRHYTFNLREFWNKYSDQEVTNWRRLVDRFEEIFKQKEDRISTRVPDFELKKESNGNDMHKIYIEVFGNDGERMYKRFVARNAALAQLNEKGIMPITFKDVDREMKYSIQNPKT